MNILLVNPPQTFSRKSQDFSIGIPVGLLGMAAVLRANGYAVEVLDALVTDFETRTLPDGRTRFGASWERLEERLKRYSPNIVGVSIPFTAQEENGIHAVRLAKRLFPGALVAAGGPHVSTCHRDFMDRVTECDVAVRGEGEEAFLEVAHCVRDKRLDRLAEIAGVSYRAGGGCVHNAPRPWIADLDALPLPAYDAVNLESYLDPNNPYLYANRHSCHKREAPLITSRGCPFSCVFCSIHLHMGKKFRANSAEYALRHLDVLVKRHGVQHIHFEDDNLTLDRPRFAALLDGMIERDYGITWDTPNGVRADTLDRELLVKAKRSGLRLLTIAVESGSQRVLDEVIQKRLSLSRVIQVAEECRDLDIPLRAFFVIGFPGERIAEMEETLAFGLRLKKDYRVDWSFLVATPLIGTKLHDICAENKYLTREVTPAALGEATTENGDFLIRTRDFSPRDIRGIIRRRRLAFLKIKATRFLQEPGKYARLILRNPSFLRP